MSRQSPKAEVPSLTPQGQQLTPRVKYMSIYPLANPERLDFTGTSCLEVRMAFSAWLGEKGAEISFPVQLTQQHAAALRGIVAATQLDAWRQLLEAVERFGRVEVHLED